MSQEVKQVVPPPPKALNVAKGRGASSLSKSGARLLLKRTDDGDRQGLHLLETKQDGEWQGSTSEHLRKLGGKSITDWKTPHSPTSPFGSNEPYSPKSPSSPKSPFAVSGYDRLHSPNLLLSSSPKNSPTSPTTANSPVSPSYTSINYPLKSTQVEPKSLEEKKPHPIVQEGKVPTAKQDRKATTGDQEEEDLSLALDGMDTGKEDDMVLLSCSPILDIGTVDKFRAESGMPDDALETALESLPAPARSKVASGGQSKQQLQQGEEELSPTGSEAWFDEYDDHQDQTCEAKEVAPLDDENLLHVVATAEKPTCTDRKRLPDKRTIEDQVKFSIMEYTQEGIEWRSIFDEGFDLGGPLWKDLSPEERGAVDIDEMKTQVFQTCLRESFSLDSHAAETLTLMYQSTTKPGHVRYLSFLNAVKPVYKSGWYAVEKARLLFRQEAKDWGLNENLSTLYEDLVSGSMASSIDAAGLISILSSRFGWKDVTYATANHILDCASLESFRNHERDGISCIKYNDFACFVNDPFFSIDVLPKLCRKAKLCLKKQKKLEKFRARVLEATSPSALRSAFSRLGLKKGDFALSGDDVKRIIYRLDLDGAQSKFDVELLFRWINSEHEASDSTVVPEALQNQTKQQEQKQERKPRKKPTLQGSKIPNEQLQQHEDATSLEHLQHPEEDRMEQQKDESKECGDLTYEEMVFNEASKVEAARALAWERSKSEALDKAGQEIESSIDTQSRDADKLQQEHRPVHQHTDYYGNDNTKSNNESENSDWHKDLVEYEPSITADLGSKDQLPEWNEEELVSTRTFVREEPSDWCRTTVSREFEVLYAAERKNPESHLSKRLAPAEDDILDFAIYLGMDPDKDREWLWLAEECLYAPLPPGWRQARDTTASGRGDFYYWKDDDPQKITQWEHPLDPFFRKLYERLKVEKQQRESDRKGNASLRQMAKTKQRAKKLKNKNKKTTTDTADSESTDAAARSFLQDAATGKSSAKLNAKKSSSHPTTGINIAKSKNRVLPFGALSDSVLKGSNKNDNSAEAEADAEQQASDEVENTFHSIACRLFKDEQVRPIWWFNHQFDTPGGHDFDPSQKRIAPEDVLELAAFFQVDLLSEPYLAWIVKAAALAKLPDGWKFCMEEFTREPFFANSQSFQVLRYHPFDPFFGLMIETERELVRSDASSPSRQEAWLAFTDDDGDKYWYDFSSNRTSYEPVDQDDFGHSTVVRPPGFVEYSAEKSSSDWLETVRESLLECLSYVDVHKDVTTTRNAPFGDVFDARSGAQLGKEELIKLLAVFEWILHPLTVALDERATENAQLRRLVQSRRQTSEQLTRHIALSN